MTDLLDVARGTGRLECLLSAVELAGLGDVLRADGPYTLFAPSDDAFAMLPDSTLDAILRDRDTLAGLLRLHLSAACLTASDVRAAARVTTLCGHALPVTAGGIGLSVGGARVVGPELPAANGVLHVIDAVLLPG